MIEREIYQKFADGRLSREEALKLIAGSHRRRSSRTVLSAGQMGMWVEHMLSPGSWAYHTPGAFKVHAGFNENLLYKALEYMLSVHPSLRTVLLREEGEFFPYQVTDSAVLPAISRFAAAGLAEDEVNRLLREDIKRPFDLEAGPLFRASLYDVSDEYSLLLFTFHHIILDGLSSQLFLRDLQTCYASLSQGRTPVLPERRADFTDYVHYEQRYLNSDKAGRDRSFWLDRLAVPVPSLELPVTGMRSAPSAEGASFSFSAPEWLVAALKSVPTSKPVTLFSIMMAAYQLVLSRLGNQTDISIGTPVAGRPEESFDNVIGNFMNMVVIRNDIDPADSLLAFIEKVHRTVLESLEHSQYPYYTLARELNDQRPSGERFLFQAAFYFQNGIQAAEDGIFLDCLHHIHQLGEFDLTLEVIEKANGCLFHLKYNPDVYALDTVETLARHYIRALEAIAGQGGLQLSGVTLLSEEERQLLLYGWNDTETAYPRSLTFVDLFCEQVKRSPHSEAVRFREESLTYLELFWRAKTLALHLQANGVAKGTFVGIYLNRSLDLLMALIGVQMAGGVYIPLDPLYPKERLADMFEESALSYVLTHSSVKSGLPQFAGAVLCVDGADARQAASSEELEQIAPLVSLQPDDPVYTIFTSGSTGKPKGIIVSHVGLTNFLCSMARQPGCTPDDRLLAVTTVCFDIAGLELYLPLIVGAQLEIAPEDMQKDGILLLDKLAEGRITMMQATPATWQMLLVAGWDSPLRIKMLCGGEALSRELADQLLPLGNGLWNLYGPTETTIWSSVSKVESAGRISIGRPIANTQFYVLDASLQPVPAGVTGELYIGGDGVAIGYLNREEETKRRFLPDPFHPDRSSRMYKTGDLARYMLDGTVDYLGRADFQVKIRGFRIELGEIENVLHKTGGIAEAVVVARDEGNDKQLTAFLVPQHTDRMPDVLDLQRQVRLVLPEYMVPSRIMYVSGYPLTLNRKVDRKQLASAGTEQIAHLFGLAGSVPMDEQSGPEKQQLHTSGSSALDLQPLVENELVRLAGIIKALPVEANLLTNLGQMGFDSISFTALAALINKHYGVKTNPTLFYSYSTIRDFAGYLTAAYPGEMASHHGGQLTDEQRHAQFPAHEARRATNERAGSVEGEGPAANAGDIAIVGMSGKLPGSANLEQFWQQIVAERDLITEIPADRWDWKQYYDETNEDPNKSVSKWGGFIPDVDKFDASFFGISPREAQLMDPQQRIMLETVWAAFEDAGYRPSMLSGSRTGVFVGATSSDYAEILMRESDIDPHTLSGIVTAVIPNRISYFYNLKGPSELTDTACSSSLVSVNRAVEAIRSGACDMALAGGVNLILSPFAHIALSKINMLSGDGRCKAFDSSANGYVRGEGCAVVFLKRMSQALADGDHIYAVIKGTAVNHGGKTNSLTAPNSTAQQELIVSAFHDAGFDPATIGYLEAHGTGTALGDPIEVNGMTAALHQLYREWDRPAAQASHCGIGSVKTNIGHLEAMAGVAGLIKVVLALHHKQLPGNLHLREVNPYLSLEGSPLYLVGQTRQWEHLKDGAGNDIPLRGGVSSFGFGGTNAHVLLEEYVSGPAAAQPAQGGAPVIIVLSAKGTTELKRQAENLVRYLGEMQASGSTIPLEKIAYTLQTGREPLQERLAVVVSDAAELLDKLGLYLQGEDPVPNLYASAYSEGLEAVLDDGDLAEILDRLASQGHWDKIARLWLKGFEPNWRRWYVGDGPGRISLPTYPFLRESHWVPVRNRKPQYGTSSGSKATLTAMLDHIAPAQSLGEGLVFRKVWSASHPIVRDHMVNGKSVFPGTGYVEMVVEATGMLGDAQTWRISDIVWLQQLTVEEAALAEVHLSVQEDGDAFRFEIESAGPDASGSRLHASGSVSSDSGTAHQAKAEFVNVSEIIARCPQYMDKQRFYSQMAAGSGIVYGPFFQAMEEVWHSAKEVLGRIKLSDEAYAELGSYTAHPVLLDCVLQSMGCLFDQNTEKGVAKLPFSAEQIHIMEPLRSREYYVYAVQAGKDVHNLALLDMQGKLCVAFHNLASREIKKAEEHSLYVPQWVMGSYSERRSSTPMKSGRVLLISGEQEVPGISGFTQALRNKMPDCLEIRVAEATSMEEGCSWTVAYNDEAAYRRTVEENGIAEVYFLGGLSDSPVPTGEIADWEARQSCGVVALFHLVKAIGHIRGIRLTVVTNGIFEVLPGESTNPVHAAISGFLKSAALEYPGLSLLLADLPQQGCPNAAASSETAHAFLEAAASGAAGELAVRRGKLYTRRIIGLDLPSGDGLAFRNRGVYWIAGAGGIGWELGLHLGRTVQARLILTGRSRLTEEMEQKLADIRRAGGEAVYIQADLTDPSALTAAIEQARVLYGSLHGVFHSAMVLQDMRIENMNEDHLISVLAPKLTGSVALGEACMDVPLDFMVLFSSTNSLLGNQGQSNYSAASSFQDAFSIWLGAKTAYPVKVINWSFWGNVGAVASDGYRSLLTEAGLLPIDTAEGMKTIGRALAQPVPQVLMFKAKPSLIHKLGFDNNIRAKVYPARLPSVIQEISLDSGSRKHGMEQIDFLKNGFKELERFGLLALWLYFRESLFPAAGERYGRQELLKALGIVPKYEQLFDALLDMLERGGLMVRDGDEVVVSSLAEDEQFRVAAGNLTALKTSLEQAYPTLAPYFHLTWQCVAHYTEVLSGRKDYVEIMFPGGSKELVQNIYRGNLIIDYYNGLVADAVCSYIRKRRDVGGGSPVRILEIGAGTGGTSAIVLDRLDRLDGPRGPIEYVYSDISASFTAYGEETYGGRYSDVRFQVLDIEKEPGGQGFTADSFDVILATNVLHATGSVERTLRNMKGLLKNKGIVVINEITKFQNFSTLTFGLTGGWWNFTDSGRIKGSPLLSAEAWEECLNRNGYTHVSIYGLADVDGVNDQSVILAEGNGVFINEGAEQPAAERAEQALAKSPPVVKNQPKPASLPGTMSPSPAAGAVTVTGNGMTDEQLYHCACQYIKQLLSRKLKIDTDKIGEQTLFDKLGVDSLIIIELNKELAKDFDKLPSTLFFEHVTVEALAVYLAREHRAKMTQRFGVKPGPQTPSPVGSLFAPKNEQPAGMTETAPAAATEMHATAVSDANEMSSTAVSDVIEMPTTAVSNATDIAIIGVSGRYPLAETLDEFWDNLKQGRNCVTEVPGDRWDWERYYDPDNREQGKGSSKWGGFIRDVDKFDAALFHIPDDHAREMDPQERLFLETTWSLLEDAGYPGQKLADKGNKVGVFVGAMYGAYGQLATSAWEKGTATNAQSAYWIIANRTSHFFNFTGPSIAVDTACSSSLTAIHYACASLVNGDCNVAVAGGINLILHPRQHVRLANLNNLAGSDRNRSFGEGADGFVEGEGIGAILLKPLNQAVRDNDYIYGVIKGTAINSGGQSSSFTTPSLSAQTEVVEQALRRSGVDPESISYVDAHATGTALGDPIEVRALSIAYSRFTSKKSYCSIGSVKSNIGHLEASSGISAMTKVLLQMRYGKLAPSIHTDRINPYIAFEGSPFYLQRELTEWNRPVILENGERKTLPRRAGISSFGAGGSNAHVIVEEYRKEAVAAYSTEPVLIVLSARQESSLLAYAEALQRFIARRLTPEAEEVLSLERIAYTLQTGRAEMKERLAFVAADLTELTGKLALIGRGEPVQGLFRGSAGQPSEREAPADISLETMASHWVAGGQVSWEALYRNSRKPDRLPLPTYCFDRQRYWLADGWALDEVPDRPAYTATYHYNEPYLRDHLSMGRRTLLGVTYCSLAYEAFRHSTPDAPRLQIRGMLFQEPVEVPEGEQVEITSRIAAEDGKLYADSLFQYSGSGPQRLASRGEVVADVVARSRSITIPSFSEHEALPGSSLYEAKPGVYGPSLFTVRTIIVSHAARTVWGQLALTAEMRQDQRAYAVHPALLDGAVLCRLALLPHGEKDALIPLMVKQMYIFGALPDECFCQVREVRTNAELWEGDIEWADADGQVLVAMKGFVCKRIRPDKNLPEGPANGRSISGTMKQHTLIPDKILAEVQMYLTDKIAGLLQENPSEMDTACHFMSMGIESGDLIALAQELQSKLDLPVYPTLFFEYPNIEELAVYLTREHGDKLTVLLPFGQELERIHPATAAQPEAEAAGAREDSGSAVADSESSSPADEPVAIIGISGYMPQSDNLTDFWNKLVRMDSMVTEIPPDRWDWRDHFKESPEDRDKTKVIWGGFMKDVDKFDPGFFGMSPREASLMDPQQRLSLELVWSAIEDAGYNPSELSGSRTSVFIGVAGHDYSDVLAEGRTESRAQALTGNAHNVLTGRISYLLNLHGPSEPIDTACSSSLVAVHRAVESLRSGDCELAIAGGVNVITSPSLYISFDNVGILSQDGTCRTFDQAAEGTVRGEGAGILLLKPLSRAIRDGDRIYGLVRGSAINHGGRSSSLTAPNPNAQADVVSMAHRKAKLDPATIGYVEAHGTGTKLGDPVEVNGLKRAFKQLYEDWGHDARAAAKHCAVGALKPNIGHLETASGIAGMIKILLAMKHQTLPGLANYSVRNPYIQLDDSPLYLVEKTQPWARLKDSDGQELPYRAGISAFGFSGVNAHVVLEEFVPEPGTTAPAAEEDGEQLIVLSARSEDRLLAYAASLHAFLIGRMDSAEPAATERKDSRLMDEVKRLLADGLNVSPEDLEEDMTLAECGLDPITIDGFLRKLEARYGSQVLEQDIVLEHSLKQLSAIVRFSGTATRPENGRTSGPLSLRDVAYTLQTGREAMEERLALIVNSVDELASKLELIAEGRSVAGRIYRDSCKQPGQTADWRTEDGLDQLARSWTAGGTYDWRRLYANPSPRKVSLPAYPFARKRYWVNRSERGLNEQRAEHSRLGALLDSNLSTFGDQLYRKVYDPSEFYLKDHIVNGRMILPGVVYLEMARSAGALSSPGQKVTGLRNVVWTQPLELTGEPKETGIRLRKTDKAAEYEIVSEQGAVYSQGEVAYDAYPEVTGGSVAIEQVLARCTEKVEHPRLYSLFEAAGFRYGPSFKPVHGLSCNRTEALSRISVPEPLRESMDDFLLHPVLLEGALQTAGFLVHHGLETASPYIPFALGSLEIHSRLTPDCWAYAAFAPEQESGGVRKLEVAIVDESGRVLIRMKDYMVRPLSKDKPSVRTSPVADVPVAQAEERNTDALLAYLREELTGILAGMVNIPAADISATRDWSQYGIESILLTELSGLINARLHLETTPALFFEVNDLTVDNVAGHLLAKKRGALEERLKESELQQIRQEHELSRLTVATASSPEYAGETVLSSVSDEGGAEPIAIIGIGGRMPQSDNLDAFWEHLREGRDLITEIPPDRFDWRDYYGDPRKEANKTNSRWGGFLEEVDKFDAAFFNLTPAEAKYMDPQQRLFFETVWETIEDAGYKPRNLSGSRTGVYVGVSNGDYSEVLAKSPVDALTMTGNNHPMIPNKISYHFGFTGPSEPIDTLCSSSLVAIHRAVEDIRSGRCDLAIAGGINVILSPKLYISYSNADMLSPDGRCKTFAKDANGFVRGEGVGALLLKTLSRAEAEGDRIYAVIRGNAVNHCGRSKSLTSPNPLAQAEVIKAAYGKAAIDPSTVTYIETHGTGTPLGDPVEINALKLAFEELYDQWGIRPGEVPHCGLGSVKTNIGHLESGAGIAGVLKILLALKHKTLPASLHVKEINPYIDVKHSPFYILEQSRPWSRLRDGEGHPVPRRAGVSSFGAGGVNAHLVFEEYVKQDAPKSADISRSGTAGSQIFVLSARNEERLLAYAERVLQELGRTEADLEDITFTSQTAREELEVRFSAVAEDRHALVHKLQQFIRGGTGDWYRGSIYDEDNLTNAGAAEQAMIQEWIERYNPGELAAHWVKGARIDWRLLHTSSARSRVAFPTYPFQKERHWIDGTDSIKWLYGIPSSGGPGAEGGDVKLTEAGGNHPLYTANTSTLRQVKFLSTLRSTAPFIRDHRIHGGMIAPGVIYLEMARALGELAAEQAVAGLQDVVWVQPLTVPEGGRELSVSFSGLERDSERLNFVISSLQADGSEIVHCQGRVLLGRQSRKEPDNLPLAELIRQCGSEETGKDFYEQAQRKGFSYGPAMRSIQKVHKNEMKALSNWIIPKECRSWDAKYMLHPSIMDGALQSTMVSGLEEAGDTAYLPFSLAELYWYRPLPEKGYVYVTPAGAGGLDAAVGQTFKKYHIRLLDEAGRVCAEFTDFAKKAAFLQPGPQHTDSFLFTRSRWIEAPLNGDGREERPRTAVVFVSGEEALLQVKDKLPGTECLIAVMPGTEFAACGKLEYRINPVNRRDYEALWRVLQERGIQPDSLLSMLTDGQAGLSAVESGFYSLAYMMQSFGQIMKPLPLQLVFAYPVHREPQETEVYHAAASALLKSMALENRLLACISLSSDQPDLLAAQAAAELRREAKPAEVEVVRYQNGRRLTGKLIECGLPLNGKGPSPFRNGGVYIISGGLGGVGRLVCKHLLSVYQARIVVFGRSPLDGEKERELRELEELGGEILYWNKDITNGSDVAFVIEETIRCFGSIHGVLHLAGTIRDAYLTRKTEEQMRQVLAPKIDGLLHLDTYTRDLPLDLFVLFSSISGQIGNVGQSDYAYANHFLDHFAVWRESLRRKGQRHGKSLSVNWPLWRDGGMTIDASAEKQMLELTGMGAMDTASACSILEAGLHSGEAHVTVFSGNRNQIAAVFGIGRAEQGPAAADVAVPAPAEAADLSAEAVSREAADSTGLRERTLLMLTEVFAKISGIAVDTFQERVPFERYGLDSIMLMKVSTELEAYLPSMSKVMFFELQTLGQLADYFTEHYELPLREHLDMLHEAAVAAEPSTEVHVPAEAAEPTLPDYTGQHNVVQPADRRDGQEIAIVGVSGKYPSAADLDEFWERLKSGTNCITEVPQERWDGDIYYDADQEVQGKSYSKWGGFIDGVDRFDPLFFNISPAEAELMDPQERLMLETVWATMEDAGYTRETLGSSVGVFVGTMYKHYPWAARHLEVGSLLASTSYWSIANRISYFFNFQAPSMVIDTACSSSLHAIHLACESIRRGECLSAVAGGINLTLLPDKYLGLSQTRMIGSADRSKSLSDGDGYVMGEGAGAVLLKPLSEAVKDGDVIYGVIKSSCSNHGGKTNSFTMPNPNAQAALVTRAVQEAGIPIDTLRYVESAANGSPLGDMIEIHALIKAFKELGSRPGSISLGTVKANIGHLEAASGISQLTKVLLQMKHRTLVPTISADPLNPDIKLEGSPLYLQQSLQEWEPSPGEPLRSLIVSFGAGGSNAALVVEEYRVAQPGGSERVDTWPLLFVWSAKNDERLMEHTRRMYSFIANHPSLPAADIAYTLLSGREGMESRVAIVAESRADLLKKLELVLEGSRRKWGIYYGTLDPMDGISGKEEADDVQRAWERGDLGGLAQMWVNGAQIEARSFPQLSQARRVPLPSYPFERKRCWITESWTGAEPGGRIAPPEEVAAGSKPERPEGYTLAELVKQLVADIVKIPVEELDADLPFHRFGFDSLSGMRFVNKLKERLGTKIPVSALYEHPTVHKLAQHLADEGIWSSNGLTEADQRREGGSDGAAEVFRMLLAGVKAGRLTAAEASRLHQKLVKTETRGGSKRDEA
ncbi:non-ribosomal peptide synthetase [Paenibacillus sp. P32E]|uniref:non-ribosomal peptide synthetase n=1 Tax=Paenibacillus sp. P32E TaxID=1349434 RepID=UPI00095A392B|nr:non-ribosomal peptide synthetase [Paenibacillus sp. P32E]OKP94477.1 hypothetical protein A3848_00355 [Paenibacillus sp. P32E]